MLERRQKLTLVFVLFLMLLGAGIIWNGRWELPEFPHDIAETDAAEEKPKTLDSTVNELADQLGAKDTAASPQGPAIDVARIAKEGTSVIAGTAEPNSGVTILEDGKPVAIAKADDTGSWSITTEHKFAATDSQLTVQPGEDEGLKKAEEEAKLAAKAPEPAAPSANQTVSEKLLNNLENMVAAAREEADKQIAKTDTPATPAPAPETAPPTIAAPAPVTPAPAAPQADSSEARGVAQVPEDEAAPDVPPPAPASAPTATPAFPTSPVPAKEAAPESSPATAAAATPATTSTTAAAAAASIPIPITFVYRETTFTPTGKRAAELLLEYLKLKKFERISLSGHADERGSAGYNMKLSEDRLSAVETFLKSGGFTGKLDLLAMGESEPFRGVDRTRTPREELLQLDRRVELRISR